MTDEIVEQVELVVDDAVEEGIVELIEDDVTKGAGTLDAQPNGHTVDMIVVYSGACICPSLICETTA